MTATPPSRRSRRVTLVDVAQRAGVDKAVVSRVVNDDPVLNIRPETRERVLAAIRELDYRPNVNARSLRTARARTVGLLIPDFANPVYAEIITGAESAATAEGYVLMAASATVASGGRAQDYLDRIGRGRVDGLLLAGGLRRADPAATLSQLGLPWLLINRRQQRARRYVILDDDGAAQIAIEHLIELGHSRIAHIAGPTTADTARRRRSGYQKALRRAGLPVDKASIAPADYTPQGGSDAMRRLLESGRPPTAVFVANVASAIGALDTLHRHGLAVPDDVSVVAVHDLPLAEHLVPALTTVRMPLRELGARAVQLLLSTDPDASIEEVVGEPTELVVRESTGPARE